MKMILHTQTRMFASLTLGFVLIFATNLEASTYTVANTNDSGAGSLRAAIEAANSTAADDTVLFNISGCPQNICTIVLSSGELSVSASNSAGSLTILNSGGPKTIVISGNNSSRILRTPPGSQVIIDGLTFTNGTGEGGGAIYNEGGSLTIRNSVIQDSVSTGYWAGGGIVNHRGTLDISRSEIRGNRALWRGGGLFSMDGTLSVRDSTIAENIGYIGGGVALVSWEGPDWTARIANCTLSGNYSIDPDGQLSAGGAIYLANSMVPVRFENVTVSHNFAGNGGAVFADGLYGGSMYFRNSIFAGNDADSYPNIDTRYGVYFNLGNNVIDGLPMIGPLGNNGGPTRTHALLTGSPAIDAGNNCVLATNGCGDQNPALVTDQRGLGRVGTVDIGAFEKQPIETIRRARFDFDGDGQTDLSVIRPVDRVWYLNRSTAGFSAVQFGLPTDRIVPADFDGDGKTDIAVFRNGTWYWLNSGSGNSLSTAHFGMAGDIPQPADFSGDGRSELAVYRSGVWYTFDLANGLVQALQFGLASDKPVVNDYDGDGRADYAVYRDGIWYILASTNGFSSVSFGLATDKPVPADYDGDGRTDPAVYRQGVWYLLQSQAGFAAVQWGVATDLPIPADYDGDGREDAAVFRDGVWYRLRSQTGYDIVSFGMSGDRPIPNAFVP